MGTDVALLKQYETLMRYVQDSTKQVFSTMLDLEIQCGPVRCDTRTSVQSAGIMAMVGMAGAISGSGCLCFSKKFACKLASRFLMTEYNEVGDDVLDAVAELSNMVVGGLKTALEEDSGPMGLSVPTVVYGENYLTRTAAIGDRFVLEFMCDQGQEREQFDITVCLITERKNRNYLRELAEFHARLM
jgi:chemotaxis protein CheX